MDNHFPGIKYFKPSEFDSPDQPGSGHGINYTLVWILNRIRIKIQLPIIINSGVRTKRHNKIVRGTIDSSHLGGFGSDIHCTNNVYRYKFISGALIYGITRIIIHPKFIHIDIDPLKPQPIILYGDP